MKELIQIAFSPVNAALTIICLLLLLYWLLVIFTGLDPDAFSIDFDADATVDTHSLDLDPGREPAADAEPGAWNSLLKFFHFDELPLLFLLTFLFISMWFISVNLTYYIGPAHTRTGLLLLIPNFLISLFALKLVARPLSWLYGKMNHKGEPAIDFIGRRCTVFTSLRNDRTGQVELVVNGDPIRIYARSNTSEELAAGRAAIIVDTSDDGRYYLVERFDYE